LSIITTRNPVGFVLLHSYMCVAKPIHGDTVPAIYVNAVSK